MDAFLHDVRDAGRALWRRPGLTVTALLTLSLGIGATTTFFAVAYGALVRPLPFRDPGGLMHVSLLAPDRDQPAGSELPWSIPKYETFRDVQDVFAATAVYRGEELTLGGGDPVRIAGERVEPGYFSVLGAVPALGRGFDASEYRAPGAASTVVLGHGLWLRRFGGQAGVIGRPVTLGAATFTVVGVMPPGFAGLSGTAEVWLPTSTADPEEWNQQWSHTFAVVGRVRAGVSPAQAAAAMPAIGRTVDEAHPAPAADAGRPWSAAAAPLDALRTDARFARTVLILLGAVATVLLIGCANLAGLLLARARAREQEMAIRSALGAGRARLVRLFLAESAVMAAAGAAGGILVAVWGVGLVARLADARTRALLLGSTAETSFTRLALDRIGLDGIVLLFAVLLALGAAILTGLAPALRASRPDVRTMLGGQARVTPGGGRRGGGALVAIQIGIALVLAIGAGLLAKSLVRLANVPTGISTGGVVTARLALSGTTRAQGAAFFASLTARAGAQPGIDAAGFGTCVPVVGRCNETVAWFDPASGPPPDAKQVDVLFVDAGYFHAVGIPLRRGRLFDGREAPGRAKAIVVNEAAARVLYPDVEPLGRPLAVGQGGFHTGATVVGVVADARYDGVDSPVEPAVYVPVSQAGATRGYLFVKSRLDTAATAAAIHREVRALDPALPVISVRTLDALAGDASLRARVTAGLLGGFAAFAILLAAVGVYGLMSWSIGERAREIGIRLALGATPRTVVSLVLRQAAALSLAGLVAGLLAALWLGRLLEALLFEVEANDPVVFATAAGAIAAVAAAAAALPARRAGRTDPLTAMQR